MDLGIDRSETLSVGVAQMDEGHKELLNKIDAFFSALIGGRTDADYAELVGGIVRSVESHFRAEEQMLVEIGYPRLEEHKKLHQAFDRELRTIVDQSEDGRPGTPALIATQDLIVNWLVDHIHSVDKQYGVFIAEQDRLSRV